VIIGLDTLPDPVCRDTFLNTGGASQLLEDAFSRLPNLRSVGLRDYDGNGRLRDGDTVKWRSYGWSLGGSCEHSRQRYAQPESIFHLLLFALDKASVRPTNLEAFLRKKRMPDRSFDLSCLTSDVTSVLSGLRTLLLSLEAAGTFSSQQGFRPTGHIHLQNFLQDTPLLEHLRLNFTNMPITESSSGDVGPEGFLRWFGIPVGLATKSWPKPIVLEYLTTLDLGMVYVTPKTLLQVVCKCAKLKALSLWKVTLQHTENRSEHADCVWSRYLPKIGKAFQVPEDVTEVMIGYAGEVTRTTHYNISEVKFASRISVDGNGEKKFEDPEGKVSYRKRVGSSVQDWLEDLGKRAFIENLDNSDDSDDSDDSEGDDELDELVDEEDNENDEDDEDDGDDEVIVLS
jgi:hypothetical protein